MIDIVVSNQFPAPWIDVERLKSAAAVVVQAEGFSDAEISLAVVDDGVIRTLNRRYLQHDYATDVLSFAFGRDENRLEGEVIVSAETAASSAPQYGWRPADELLLYVIHGLLHLAAYDDQQPADRRAMRRREQHYLQRLGVPPANAPRGRRDAAEFPGEGGR